jgi:hypothetical protein
MAPKTRKPDGRSDVCPTFSALSVLSDRRLADAADAAAASQGNPCCRTFDLVGVISIVEQ